MSFPKRNTWFSLKLSLKPVLCLVSKMEKSANHNVYALNLCRYLDHSRNASETILLCKWAFDITFIDFIGYLLIGNLGEKHFSLKHLYGLNNYLNIPAPMTLKSSIFPLSNSI